MLYFDRMTEEHFGSIKQQVWSFLHFPLHTVLVLVLQGVSLLIIWRQAVESMRSLNNLWDPALAYISNGSAPDNSSMFGVFMAQVRKNYTTGTAVADYLNYTCYSQVYTHIPKGVDVSKETKAVAKAWLDISQGLDNYMANDGNATARSQLLGGLNSMTSSTYKTLFDTFSVTVAKSKNKKTGSVPDLLETQNQYFKIFDLIMSYTFVAVSLSYFSILQNRANASPRAVSHSSSSPCSDTFL
jgi:hypothetical protein